MSADRQSMNTSGSRPVVSVFLPCFNAHAHLQQAVDSVRNQTFKDLEILVIDDGSTDPATLALLDSLGNDVRVVRQENRGLPGARNRGFAESRGYYVVPLDCDDWLEPEFVEKGVKALEAAGEKAFVFAHFYLEGDESGPLAKNYNGFEQLFVNQLPYCLLMPKSLWAEVGGYDETMQQGFEDWEFNIRIGLAGATGVVIEEPLFHYRVSGSGMLKSLSVGKFAELWGHIQDKHRDVYTWPALRRWRKHWRGRPSTYPAVLLFGFFALHRLLPNAVFNAIFRNAMKYSHTRREAAKRNRQTSLAM
jgi:glycosyltransferase involved in cell wall biosynthesis